MEVPNISGVWKSKLGQLIYVITQVGDRFVWRTRHNNGVVETGIGWFPPNGAGNEGVAIVAQWDFHSGQLDSGVRGCSGKVIMRAGAVEEIHWQGRDDFFRVAV